MTKSGAAHPKRNTQGRRRITGQAVSSLSNTFSYRRLSGILIRCQEWLMNKPAGSSPASISRGMADAHFPGLGLSWGTYTHP